MFDYAERRRRLSARLRAEDVELLFLAPSADLEYLTGAERAVPNFGESSYATDDGAAVFERVVRGLGSPGTVAVGDRVWAETVVRLGQILGFGGIRTGSSLVNELRRVKSNQELETMARAVDVVEEAMAAVTPKVLPGVSMLDLLEEVEHELRARGSRTPSFATHVFTGLGPGDVDSGTATARDPLGEGSSVIFDFGAVADGYCSDFGRTGWTCTSDRSSRPRTRPRSSRE